jgi:hypothetical protein
LSSRPTTETPAGRLFLALRKRARLEGRGTDELLQMHALEAFVYRLSMSPHAADFALKGGVLLSAYDVRRPTRDVDLSARGLSNAVDAVQRVLGEVAALPCPDGWEMQTTGADVIREDAAYSGVRVKMVGHLMSAQQTFHIDVSFGDPVVPAPSAVSIERLLGGRITLPGYPLTMVLAEKLMTAVQLGVANTRWRDYWDVYALSRSHRIEGDLLAQSLAEVARARGVEMRALSVVTVGYADLAQDRWTAWLRKQGVAAPVPPTFAELLAAVHAFADAPLTSRVAASEWDPGAQRWR